MSSHRRLLGLARSRLSSRQQAVQQGPRDGAEASPGTQTVSPPGERIEFEKPVISEWDLCIPCGPALGRLLSGFRPESMDDKWMVWAEERQEHGASPPTSTGDEGSPAPVTILHFVRSWTGHPMARVTVEPQSKGDGGRFTKIVWESSEKRAGSQTEKRAKEMVLQVCVDILRVDWHDQVSK